MKHFYFKKLFFSLCLLFATGILFSVRGGSITNKVTGPITSDKAEPQFATRESFVIFLDENGEAGLDPAEYNLGTIVADCEIVSITYDRTDFNCEDIGFHVIQVTATDCNGLSATTEADVEVRNEIIPKFLGRESFVIFLDENGKAELNPDQVNRDNISANCGIDRIELSQTEFDCEDVGFHEVTVTAFDKGTYSFSTTADVEVRNEIIPKFLGRESFVIFLDENGKAELNPDQVNRDNISANCGIDRIELSQTEFDCEDVGFHEVTVTAFDKGTYSFSTTADVEVRNEIIPKFVGRESFIIFLDENGRATLSPDQINRDNISANCGIDRIELSQTEFDCEDVGFHEVTVTAFDKGTYSFSTTADVEVRNEIIPKFLGRESFVIFLDENGKAELNPDQINRDNISANCGIDRIELSQTEFDCEDVGFHEVTVTAFDKGTYSFSTTADVEVRNEVIPKFVGRESFIIFLDENGKAELNPDQVNRDNISANCGIDRIELSQTEFDCEDVGFHEVTVTAFDKGTYSFSTTADVEVRNEIIPKFLGRESFVIFLDENGKAELNPDQVNRDNISANCGIDRIELSQTEFDCEDVGFHEVTVTAFDKGTYSFSTTADVEVRNEIQPRFFTRESFVITLDENGRAILSPDQYNRETISANCGIDRIEFDRTEFDCGDIGDNVIKVTAFDFGTFSFETEADVRIEDNLAPVITLIGDEIINLNLGEPYTESGASVEDNCSDAPLIIGGDVVDTNVPGTFSVTYEAVDESGNAATELTRTVNVIDNIPPVIIANDMTVFTRDDRCSAVVESYDLTITDESGIQARFLNFLEGTVFPTGVTEVSVFARDNAGNVSTDTFTVTVVDNVAPTIEVFDMQVFLDENGQGSLPDFSAPEVIFSDDFESDEVGRGQESLTNWNVTAGNVDVLTGVNRALPTTDIALALAGDINGAIESIESVTLTPGNYRLRVDYWGESGEEASFNVQIGEVLNDSITDFVNEFFEPAEFDFVVTEATTGTIRFTEFGWGNPNSGTIIDNVRLLRQPDFNVYDNCQVTGITASQSDFTCADIGVKPVTITVADAAGNMASVEIQVEVIDNIAPVAVAQNITVALGPDGTVTIDPRDVDGGSSDSCDLTFSLSKTTFTCADLSNGKKWGWKRGKKSKRTPKNQVTLTVTDASGNTSSATAIVKVVDNQGPVFSQEPITLYVSGRSWVRLTRAEVASRVSDNCGVRYFSVPRKRFSGGDEGLNEVKVKATDRSGNSSTGRILVNVVDISHLGRGATMCLNGKTIKVRSHQVQRWIRRGASLGSCNNLLPIAARPDNVDQQTILPETEPLVRLSAYPNPAKSLATITFSSTDAGRATLTIFNSGRPKPMLLFDQEIEANTNQKVTFDTNDLPVGVYILRLTTTEGIKTMKLLVRR